MTARCTRGSTGRSAIPSRPHGSASTCATAPPAAPGWTRNASRWNRRRVCWPPLHRRRIRVSRRLLHLSSVRSASRRLPRVCRWLRSLHGRSLPGGRQVWRWRSVPAGLAAICGPRATALTATRVSRRLPRNDPRRPCQPQQLRLLEPLRQLRLLEPLRQRLRRPRLVRCLGLLRPRRRPGAQGALRSASCGKSKSHQK